MEVIHKGALVKVAGHDLGLQGGVRGIKPIFRAKGSWNDNALALDSALICFSMALLFQSLIFEFSYQKQYELLSKIGQTWQM